MTTHGDIWAALDRLAAAHGLSPSALARRAGLDPTTFNRSKRIAADGKLRWPSTESLAKALAATGAGFEEFSAFLAGERPAQRSVPVIGLAQAGSDGFFDDAGFPLGAGWDAVDFPGPAGKGTYALEVTGDSMVPVFRDGDIVIVAPAETVRRHDRVVVKTVAGEVMVKELTRRTASHIELASLNPAYPPRSLRLADIAWIARIIWSSQ